MEEFFIFGLIIPFLLGVLYFGWKRGQNFTKAIEGLFPEGRVKRLKDFRPIGFSVASHVAVETALGDVEFALFMSDGKRPPIFSIFIPCRTSHQIQVGTASTMRRLSHKLGLESRLLFGKEDLDRTFHVTSSKESSASAIVSHQEFIELLEFVRARDTSFSGIEVRQDTSGGISPLLGLKNRFYGPTVHRAGIEYRRLTSLKQFQTDGEFVRELTERLLRLRTLLG